MSCRLYSKPSANKRYNTKY